MDKPGNIDESMLVSHHVDDSEWNIPNKREKDYLEMRRIIERRFPLSESKNDETLGIVTDWHFDDENWENNYCERSIVQYIIDAAYEHQVIGMRMSRVPMSQDFKKVAKVDDDEEVRPDVPYCQLMGKLVWIGRCQHLCILGYVNALSQYNSCWTRRHYHEGQKILKWSYDHREEVKHIIRPIRTDGARVRVYFDSSHCDEKDFMSTTQCVVLFVDSTCVDFRVRSRRGFKTGTKGDEVDAGLTGMKMIMHVQRIIEAMGIKIKGSPECIDAGGCNAPELIGDNKGCMDAISGGKVTEESQTLKSKYFIPRHRWFKWLENHGWISGARNISDLGTKTSHSGETFEKHTRTVQFGENIPAPDMWLVKETKKDDYYGVVHR